MRLWTPLISSALAAFSLAALLAGCAWQETNATSGELGEREAAVEVADAPREHLPVLNSEALSQLQGSPEGTSGGLMSHQWNVGGEVVACDEENGIIVVSVDSDNCYFQYLNSPILISAGHETKFAVGDKVLAAFLPPGSEETVVHPSSLLKS